MIAGVFDFKTYATSKIDAELRTFRDKEKTF